MFGLPRWRNPYFQPCSVSWGRFYREFARQQAHSFPNHPRPYSSRLQFGIRQPSRKRKSLAIVLHRQLQSPHPGRQPYQDMLRSAVFAHVHQTLLHNACQFPAGLLRQIHPLQFADKLGCDSGLPAEALHRIGNETKEPVDIHLERLHGLHQFAQLQNFFAQQLLDAPELRVHHRCLRSRLAPEHVQLHFHSDQRLNRSIVKFAREPPTLQRPRPLPQPPHQVHVVDRRPHLLREFLQEPQFLFRVPHHLGIEQEYPPRPLVPEQQRHRNYRVKLLHPRQRIQKFRAGVAQPHAFATEQHGRKTVGTTRRVDRVRRRLKQIYLFAFRQSVAPAQRSAVLGATTHFGQKYPVTVPFLRGAQHPARAVDAHDLPKNLLQGSTQSRLDPRRTENPRDYDALGPRFLLVLRHIAQQEAEDNQIHRTHEELLRIQFAHAHAEARQMHPPQPPVHRRFQSRPHHKSFRSEERRVHRTHEELLRIQFAHAHAEARQMHHPQPPVHRRFQSRPHHKRFGPQQCHRCRRRAYRLPQPPAIGGRRHHEHEEEKEGSALRRREQGNQHRPEDVDCVHDQTKRFGGLGPEAHQQHHHHRIHQVSRQKPVQPARIRKPMYRLHPKGKLCRNRQRHPRRRQPALGAADFAVTERRPEAP